MLVSLPDCISPNWLQAIQLVLGQRRIVRIGQCCFVDILIAHRLEASPICLAGAPVKRVQLDPRDTLFAHMIL